MLARNWRVSKKTCPMSSSRRPVRAASLPGSPWPCLSHVDRRGRLRLGGRALATSGFADLDFDLRDVTIDHWQTTVTVLAAFGNVDVYVPEGVNVNISGISLVGHRRDWGRDTDRPNTPTIHVRVLGFAGTLTSGGCRRTCGTPAIATSSASFKAAASASFPAEVGQEAKPGHARPPTLKASASYSKKYSNGGAQPLACTTADTAGYMPRLPDLARAGSLHPDGYLRPVHSACMSEPSQRVLRGLGRAQTGAGQAWPEDRLCRR